MQISVVQTERTYDIFVYVTDCTHDDIQYHPYGDVHDNSPAYRYCLRCSLEIDTQED